MPKKLPGAADITWKKLPGFITKVDAEAGIVDAIVSTMGVLDYGEDVIENGAYLKTIQERGSKIKVLNSHNTYSIFDAIGVCLALREIGRDELPAELLAQFPEATGGLLTTTQYLLNTPEGRGAFERIKAGVISEYSIGYQAIKTEYRDVMDSSGFKVNARILKEIKLYEYSPVLWGMNPATMTTGVKSAGDAVSVLEQTTEEVRDWLEQTTKAGRTISARNAARLREAFSALHSLMEDAGLLEDPAADEDVDSADTVEENDKSATPPDEPGEPLITDEPQAEPVEAPLTRNTLEKERLKRLIEIGLSQGSGGDL